MFKHNLICYSPKTKEAFDNNVMWPSIYCVNLVAILKLSYPLKQRLPDQTCLPIYVLWQVNRIRNWPYDFWEVEIVKSLQIQERQTTDAGQNVLNLIFNLAVDVVELWISQVLEISFELIVLFNVSFNLLSIGILLCWIIKFV